MQLISKSYYLIYYNTIDIINYIIYLFLISVKMVKKQQHNLA